MTRAAAMKTLLTGKQSRYRRDGTLESYVRQVMKGVRGSVAATLILI